MDLTPAHLQHQEGKKKKKDSDLETSTKKKKKREEDKEETNIYTSLTSDDDEDEDEDDEEESSLDDDDDEGDFDDEPPFFKTPKGIAIIAGAVVALGLVAFLVFGKGEEQAAPPAPTEPAPAEETIDPATALKDSLYKKGIGKEAVDEENIYEQGNIESADFRKDFVSTDAPEHYVEPIEIMGVNDSVSYVKHRTMTDDGMDMYWVDAEYKGKKTRFTVPYYIWRTLAPQGVMDVIVETIVDAEDNTFVGSITAVPPSGEE